MTHPGGWSRNSGPPWRLITVETDEEEDGRIVPVEAILLTPHPSGEVIFDVVPLEEAAARVEGDFPHAVQAVPLPGCPGHAYALTNNAGEQLPGLFPPNFLAAAVSHQLDAPATLAWNGPAAFYSTDPNGNPAPLTTKATVLITSLAVLAVEDFQHPAPPEEPPPGA